MSQALLALARDFVEHRIDGAAQFAGDFMDGWKRERDSGALLLDSPQLSELLSTIFCLADMFNLDEDRAAYEFDELRLWQEVAKRLRDAVL